MSSPSEIKSVVDRLDKERIAHFNKLQDLELEIAEYGLVVEALKKVPKDRRCFRMVANVLVEHKAGEVLPTLVSQKEKMTETVKTLENELAQLVDERNTYASKLDSMATASGLKPTGDSSEVEGNDARSTGVLV